MVAIDVHKWFPGAKCAWRGKPFLLLFFIFIAL